MNSAVIERSPVEHIAHAACELMRDRERAMLRMCEQCGSQSPRHQEDVCPSCGQETHLLCVNISRVQ